MQSLDCKERKAKVIEESGLLTELGFLAFFLMNVGLNSLERG